MKREGETMIVVSEGSDKREVVYHKTLGHNRKASRTEHQLHMKNGEWKPVKDIRPFNAQKKSGGEIYK